MFCTAYFKSGLGNFISAIPAFIALSTMDERGLIDLVLDKDWIQDPRVPAIKELAGNSYYIDKIKYWPDVDLDTYSKFFLPVQCELSACAREMMRRNKNNGLIKGYMWPNALWRDVKLHEIDVNMNNVKCLGYTACAIPRAYIPRSLRSLFFPGGGKRSRPFFFGFCNGAFQAKFWEKKKWPYFAELAKQLKKYFSGCKIVGVGGADELSDVSLDYDYTGRTNIMQTARIINDLDYFVTTDTGCMHIADSLKKNGIVLFGPTLISKNGPISKTMHAVRKNIRCAPCQEGEGFYTCNSNACMDMMTPDIIMDRIIKDFV